MLESKYDYKVSLLNEIAQKLQTSSSAPSHGKMSVEDLWFVKSVLDFYAYVSGRFSKAPRQSMGEIVAALSKTDPAGYEARKTFLRIMTRLEASQRAMHDFNSYDQWEFGLTKRLACEAVMRAARTLAGRGHASALKFLMRLRNVDPDPTIYQNLQHCLSKKS